MNMLTAIPLVTAGYDAPKGWRDAPEHWTAGYMTLYRSGYDPARILWLARLPTIGLFIALILSVYAFVATEASEWWALLAAALTALCPNLIAHGRLATVDMGATTFMFAATALWIRALRVGDRRPHRAILIGILAGAAVLSKTSALVLGPFFLVAALVLRRWNWRVAIIALISAIGLLEGIYLLQTSGAYLEAAGARRTVVMPFVEYAKNVTEVGRFFERGHHDVQYLMGELSYTGWPHYFLVAWLLKVPVAAQLLVIGAIVLTVRRRHSVAAICLLFVAVFFAISSLSRIDLGIRYILPVFPFAYSAVAIAFAAANVRPVIAQVLIALHVLAGVLAYPGYVSYFNVLIGSHRNADRYLIDSNLDWGQDLRRLRLWTEENGVDFIRIDYFGGGSVEHEFGKRGEVFTAPRPGPLPEGWFAVSRHLYRARAAEVPVDYATYLEASRARYVTTVGGSIYVYRVE